MVTSESLDPNLIDMYKETYNFRLVTLYSSNNIFETRADKNKDVRFDYFYILLVKKYNR